MVLMVDVLLLLGLIFGVLILAWKFDAWVEQRREKRLCPRCQGISKQEAFDSGGFVNWCPTHRDSWYEVSTIWVK
jgi:hypothetical protein